MAKVVEGFREVRRVLKHDGTLWLNLGDSYATNGGAHGGRDDNQTGVVAKTTHEVGAGDQKQRRAPQGLKPKDLVGIPWSVAFALRADGWRLRADIVWAKANCMPESVTDRPTRSHEFIFLLTKSAHYFYDHEAIKEPCIYGVDGKNSGGKNSGGKNSGGKNSGQEKQRGHSRRHDGLNDRWDQMEKQGQCTGMRNKRDVWTIAPASYPEAHFATFPPDLIKPCILASSRPGDTVLDPFFGSGTTGQVACEYGRNCIGIELNPQYVKLAKQRTCITPGLAL